MIAVVGLDQVAHGVEAGLDRVSAKILGAVWKTNHAHHLREGELRIEDVGGRRRVFRGALAQPDLRQRSAVGKQHARTRGIQYAFHCRRNGSVVQRRQLFYFLSECGNSQQEENDRKKMT